MIRCPASGLPCGVFETRAVTNELLLCCASTRPLLLGRLRTPVRPPRSIPSDIGVFMCAEALRKEFKTPVRRVDAVFSVSGACKACVVCA